MALYERTLHGHARQPAAQMILESRAEHKPPLGGDDAQVFGDGVLEARAIVVIDARQLPDEVDRDVEVGLRQLATRATSLPMVSATRHSPREPPGHRRTARWSSTNDSRAAGQLSILGLTAARIATRWRWASGRPPVYLHGASKERRIGHRQGRNGQLEVESGRRSFRIGRLTSNRPG
ncbi:MAG: hypothetical protein R3E87_27290 [Burkholderiaceae bacterium]